ncbi:hypothetical protein CsSME_00013044 [Camellia sinensis var. sinensis]
MQMEIKDVSILFAQENMWFADDDDDDDDDDDITASTSTHAGPRTDSTTEEINDLRRRVDEHDRRLQKMEKMFKAKTYVIIELLCNK